MNIKPISLAIAVLGTGFTVLSGASYASGYHFGTQKRLGPSHRQRQRRRSQRCHHLIL